MTKNKKPSKPKKAPPPKTYPGPEPGSLVFVRVEQTLVPGVLTKYSGNMPAVSLLRVARGGGYVPDFRNTQMFEADRVSRVYSQRDWDSIDTMKTNGHTTEHETAAGHEVRKAVGPATDELQRPRKRKAVDRHPNGFPVKPAEDALAEEYGVGAAAKPDPANPWTYPPIGSTINVKVPRTSTYEGVQVSRHGKDEVYFIAADGEDGSVKRKDEGKTWWYAGGPLEVDRGRFAGDAEPTEKTTVVEPAPKPARKRASKAKPEAPPAAPDPEQLAKNAETKRRRVDRQGNKAASRAVGATPMSPVDSVSAEAIEQERTIESGAIAQQRKAGAVNVIRPATDDELASRARMRSMMDGAAPEVNGHELIDDTSDDEPPPWEVA